MACQAGLTGDGKGRGPLAVALENDEPLQAIAQAATQEIDAIDAALARMAHGLYGVCIVCGEEITAGRLSAVPYAVTCEECSNP